jgi:hypothetical protein
MGQFRKVYLCAFALVLTGCAPQLKAQISGFDGSAVDPVTQEQFTTECRAKAQVASVTVPHGGGAFVRALEMGEVQRASFEGCMAEKGLKVTMVPIETASVRPPAVPASTEVSPPVRK